MVKYKDEYFPGNHMPLIDNELFEKANSRLNAYLSSFGEHSTYTKYMLSGLTVCGICGRPYYRRNSQTKIGGIKKNTDIIPVKAAKQIYQLSANPKYIAKKNWSKKSLIKSNH